MRWPILDPGPAMVRAASVRGPCPPSPSSHYPGGRQRLQGPSEGSRWEPTGPFRSPGSPGVGGLCARPPVIRSKPCPPSLTADIERREKRHAAHLRPAPAEPWPDSRSRSMSKLLTWIGSPRSWPSESGPSTSPPQARAAPPQPRSYLTQAAGLGTVTRSAAATGTNRGDGLVQPRLRRGAASLGQHQQHRQRQHLGRRQNTSWPWGAGPLRARYRSRDTRT